MVVCLAAFTSFSFVERRAEATVRRLDKKVSREEAAEQFNSVYVCAFVHGSVRPSLCTAPCGVLPTATRCSFLPITCQHVSNSSLQGLFEEGRCCLWCSIHIVLSLTKSPLGNRMSMGEILRQMGRFLEEWEALDSSREPANKNLNGSFMTKNLQVIR